MCSAANLRFQAAQAMEKKEKMGGSHHLQSLNSPLVGLQELIWMASVATCIKLLLLPSYHSTDFEVHRHWLAITHSLPFQRWYLDETSQWTLDYPPFFAWFERFLAFFAQWVDPQMLDLVKGLDYAGDKVVLFQRITVMLGDGLLYWGLWRCCRKLSLERQRLVYMAVVWSPGLFIVDHIHFQYNGFLLGILLLSLSFLTDGNDLMGGVMFAVLLCFKHLFAVAGPVYFVYLLRHYCRGPRRVSRFFTLALSVAGVMLLAFGPFVYYGQIAQVLKRLFPFGRGLCHAYWAPNFWALYNAADKIISVFLRKLGFPIETLEAAMTSGLVGDLTSHAVLPQITPVMTLILVILAMLPCLIRIWKQPEQNEVVNWISYAYMCGFMFGWHVHEKASLHFVIPLSLVAVNNYKNARDYFFLSTVSYYSLFPLLFESKEYMVKVFLLLLHSLLMWASFSTYLNNQAMVEKHRDNINVSSPSEIKPDKTCNHILTSSTEDPRYRIELHLPGRVEWVYLLGLLIVEIYGKVMHPWIFKGKLPFFPLMLISLYCAVGMVYSWILQLVRVS